MTDVDRNAPDDDGFDFCRVLISNTTGRLSDKNRRVCSLRARVMRHELQMLIFNFNIRRLNVFQYFFFDKTAIDCVELTACEKKFTIIPAG